MSGWLEAVKEVYRAGGSMAVARMLQPVSSVDQARRHGLIAPGRRGGKLGHRAVLTQRGVEFMEGRLVLRILPVPTLPGQQRIGGRLKGSGGKWCATWLMALPRPNEIRLAPGRQ